MPSRGSIIAVAALVVVAIFGLGLLLGLADAPSWVIYLIVGAVVAALVTWLVPIIVKRSR